MLNKIVVNLLLKAFYLKGTLARGEADEYFYREFSFGSREELYYHYLHGRCPEINNDYYFIIFEDEDFAPHESIIERYGSILGIPKDYLK